MPHAQQEVNESNKVLPLTTNGFMYFCAAGELLRVVGIWFSDLVNVLWEVQERVGTLTKQ